MLQRPISMAGCRHVQASLPDTQAAAMEAMSELSHPVPETSAASRQAPASSLAQAGEGRRKKKITRRVGYAREASEDGGPTPATAVAPTSQSSPSAAAAAGKAASPDSRRLPEPAHALVAAGKQP